MMLLAVCILVCLCIDYHYSVFVCGFFASIAERSFIQQGDGSIILAIQLLWHFAYSNKKKIITVLIYSNHLNFISISIK